MGLLLAVRIFQPCALSNTVQGNKNLKATIPIIDYDR